MSTVVACVSCMYLNSPENSPGCLSCYHAPEFLKLMKSRGHDVPDEMIKSAEGRREHYERKKEMSNIKKFMDPELVEALSSQKEIDYAQVVRFININSMADDVKEMCKLLSNRYGNDDDWELEVMIYEYDGESGFRWEILLCDDTQVYLSGHTRDFFEAPTLQGKFKTLCEVLEIPVAISPKKKVKK